MLSSLGWISLVIGMIVIFIGDTINDIEYVITGTVIGAIGLVLACVTTHPGNKYDRSSNR